jgi:aspartate racemase
MSIENSKVSSNNTFVPTKKLGVLGGMGPAASAEFLRLLAAKAPATVDQEHPVVYMISDSLIPDRSSAILGRGEDPSERLKQDLHTLEKMGADLLAVPCNTAHYFIDGFRSELNVPLVHIIEETVLAAKRLNPTGCWMLSTVGTQRSGLYQKYAEKIGFTLWIPGADVTIRAQESINLVKAGKLSEAGALMRELVLELWQEKDIPVMAACTEIPLAYDASGLPQEKTVSSLSALAEACLAALYKPE